MGEIILLTITTLASGSEGNCALVCGDGAAVLIDAGISCRRILASLDRLTFDPAALSAIVITHEHSDHVCGLDVLQRRLGVPVYASRGTARQLAYRIPFAPGDLRPFSAGESFSLGALTVGSFPTSHDAADSVGYTFTCGGARLAHATDLGVVTPAVLDAVLGSDAVVVETNHDVELLRSGPYPYPLKERILGERGHLCNEAGAELAARAAQAGAGLVILAHLSRQNNSPQHALTAVRRGMEAAGIDPARVTVTVAPRSEPGKCFCVQREGAVC